MNAVDSVISRLEDLSGQDVQCRNIGPLAAYVRGNLARAAASIARHPSPSVAIITGFYLEHGDPPNCETDGPPGAVMIAAGLSAAGIPCRIATDVSNAQVVLATLAATDLDPAIQVDIVSMHEQGGDGGTALAEVVRTWRGMQPPITHAIAIERCGPSRDGVPRDARGVDITSHNAPLDRLFSGGSWTTIGIGDLGNEIGMGSLPHDLVARHINGGEALWCHVPCDYPLVGGVSNWSGAALLGAISLLWHRRPESMLESIKPEFGRRLLEAAVLNGGAVASDRAGGIPRPQLFVDGQPWRVLEQVHREIYDACFQLLSARGAALSI